MRSKARAAGADEWLSSLPAIVAELATAWSLQLGRVLPGATEAFVVEAEMEDGAEAVLKVVLPQEGDPAACEVDFLSLADGKGCARLLAHDLERGALLLERLGPSLYELGLPLGARHEILVSVARQVWRPLREGRFTDGAAKAASLSEAMSRRWQELGHPVSRRTLDHALACAERRERAHRAAGSALLHGDVHQWNTLSGRDGFKLIDPDGIAAEPECDLGVIMREDASDQLSGDPTDRARLLARLAGGLDPVAVWEWGCAERLSTGLLARQIGLEPVASEMLAAAERVAAEGWAP